MSLKSLNLDQSKLDDAITEFGLDEDPVIDKKGTGYNYTIKKDGEKALIIFYFNKDGTTTINPNVGRNTTLSNEFAQFVKEKCLITSINIGSVSGTNISEDDFLFLFEYLEENIPDMKILKSEESDGDKRYRLKSPYNDEVTLTYYHTETVLLQGRPLFLFQEIKLFLYDLLTFEEVVANESKTYKIDLKIEQVRQELKAFMPTAFGFLEEKIIKILTPSVSLIKLDIPLEDYSSFAFPALRGLEGYIRQLLIAKGKTDTVRNTRKLGAIFDKGSNSEWKLIDEIKKDIPCNKTCYALVSAYSLLDSRRHPYFHVRTQIETTPIIWNKKDSESLIFEVFSTIEQTYSQIP